MWQMNIATRMLKKRIFITYMVAQKLAQLFLRLNFTKY